MTSQIQANMETQDYYINRLKELTQRESSEQQNYPNVFETSRDIQAFNEQYKDQMEKGETIEDQIESIAGRADGVGSQTAKAYGTFPDEVKRRGIEKVWKYVYSNVLKGS